MAAEWKGGTLADYQAFKAAQRAEQAESLQTPLRERREQLERRQAHIENELERLRSVELNTGGSEKLTAQIAELEREWQSGRQIEAKLVAEELVVNKAVTNINSKPLF